MVAAKLTMNTDTFTTPSLSPTSYKSAPEIIPPEEANAIIQRLEDSPITGDDVTVPVETSATQTASRGGPAVPLRSSSNSQAQTLTSVPAPEKTSDELKPVSRRGSKDSIREKSRSGSLVSRLSKREKSTGPSLAVQEKSEYSQQAVVPSTTPKPKKRFLSFLNCCGGSDNANIEATEPAVPHRKANVLQSNKNRQPNPLLKANPKEGDSSVAESKDVPEETIGGTPYAEQTAAEKPKMITRRSKEADTTEKPTVNKTVKTSEREMVQHESSQNASLPPLPVVGTSGTTNEPAAPEPPLSSQENASIPPNPPQAIPVEESVATQGEVINDRTIQQEQNDSDIAMTEAPPIAPEVEDASRSTEPEKEEQATQITLPPPPPRDNQARPTLRSDPGPDAERRQWLLPPIQPRFKGKKCLVLDLDETLVHSSFKVRTRDLKSLSCMLT